MDRAAHDVDCPFDERRQAYGWLVWQWSVYLGAILAMGAAMLVMWGGSPSVLAGGLVAALGLVLLSGSVWGWRIRSQATEKQLRDAARSHGIRWWEVSTFAAGIAARRLGWNPKVVAWGNRLLVALVNVLALLVTVQLLRATVA